MKNYRKYTWIGNRLSEKDMQKLYRLKEKTGKPITMLVAEAVGIYTSNRDKRRLNYEKYYSSNAGKHNRPG